MQPLCLNCNKPLPKGVQSSFCSRSCWVQYKDKRGLAMNPEKQATIMIKDSSRNLISSLKSELDKKDEIIQHQDKLIREYRESLESRENDINRLQSRLKSHDSIIAELRDQLEEFRTQSSASRISIQSRVPVSAGDPNAGSVIETLPSSESKPSEEFPDIKTDEKLPANDPEQRIWARFRRFLAKRFL